MMLRLTLELSASIGQYTQQRDAMLLEEGQYPIVQDISRSNRVFAGIELAKSHPAVGVVERLLVYPPHSLDIANVVSVL